MSKKLFILLCLCFVFSLAAFAQEEYGDAPEGVLAYPSLGVNGQFPTCKTVGPAGWIQHTNFGAWFGPAFELELDGNAGACPGFAPYDLDECFADGDAGLLVPDSYTIVAGAVALCPNSAGIPLGNTCQTAVWGGNIDIDVINNMPNNTDGLVNVIIDWDQNGQTRVLFGFGLPSASRLSGFHGTVPEVLKMVNPRTICFALTQVNRMSLILVMHRTMLLALAPEIIRQFRQFWPTMAPGISSQQAVLSLMTAAAPTPPIPNRTANRIPRLWAMTMTAMT
ncbi:MAG: hypothetical protein ACYSUH_09915, partial [Planctomycetota bacterium]